MVILAGIASARVLYLPTLARERVACHPPEDYFSSFDSPGVKVVSPWRPRWRVGFLRGLVSLGSSLGVGVEKFVR